MIHEPLVSEISYTNVSQVIELGESLKQTKEQINSILEQTTKKDIQIINKDTRQNKYFTAGEAIQYGLIDGLWDNSWVNFKFFRYLRMFAPKLMMMDTFLLYMLLSLV